MPEQNKVPSEQPNQKEGNDIKAYLMWIGLALVVIMLVFGGWWIWKQLEEENGAGETTTDNVEDKEDDQEAVDEDQDEDEGDEEAEDNEDQDVAKEVSWETFSDDETEVEFDYPEGAEITGGVDHTEEICKDTNSCFEYTVEYQELTVTITGVTGIGGMPTSPGEKYLIISGSQHEGLGRSIDVDAEGGAISGSYFEYTEGPLVPVPAVWVRFSVVPDSFDDLSGIADQIACSFYDLDRNSEYVYGMTYTNGRGVYWVDEDGESEVVFYAGIYHDNENMDDSIVSPNSDYIAVCSRIGNTAEQYLYVYNVAADELLEIGGENNWGKIGEYPVWISDTEFVYYGTEVPYKFDVTGPSQTELAQDEYLEYVGY